LQFLYRGREKWKNGDVKSAVTSTIQKREIPMPIFHPILLLIDFLIAGFALCVGLQKTNLKRFRQAKISSIGENEVRWTKRKG
jgi:hypothetical protein